MEKFSENLLLRQVIDSFYCPEEYINKFYLKGAYELAIQKLKIIDCFEKNKNYLYYLTKLTHYQYYNMPNEIFKTLKEIKESLK